MCMIVKLKLIFFFFFCCFHLNSFSQVTGKNPFLKWTTWTLMQAIPSPVYFEDSDSKRTSFKFGLQWNITPFSYSFGSNKMVSPLSFFFIRPVKRFSGSIELFFQPSLITGNYKYVQ